MRQILALMIIDWAWRQQTHSELLVLTHRLKWRGCSLSLQAAACLARPSGRGRRWLNKQLDFAQSQSDFYQVKHFQSNKPDFMWTEGFICKMTPKPQWQTSSNDLCVDAANIHILTVTLSVFISSSVNFLNSRSTYIINNLELLIVSVFRLKFVASEKNPDSH